MTLLRNAMALFDADSKHLRQQTQEQWRPIRQTDGACEVALHCRYRSPITFTSRLNFMQPSRSFCRSGCLSPTMMLCHPLFCSGVKTWIDRPKTKRCYTTISYTTIFTSTFYIISNDLGNNILQFPQIVR